MGNLSEIRALILNKAVFLDRDGVINRDYGYVSAIEDFDILPGAFEALRVFRSAGYKLIVITNQAGVARGLYSEAAVEKLHNYMCQLLEAEGVYLDDIYFCPHHPVSGVVASYSIECECRKPAAGMINQAMLKHKINASRSLLIGDKGSDILAGINAGIGRNILVTSQYPLDINKEETFLRAENLLDATKYI